MALGNPHRRPARQAPAALRLNDREFLARHSQFVLHLPAPTVRRLNDHARRLLDTHGCRHEPLTWSLPTNGIALDQLPGPDPDTIDAIRVHAAITRQRTPAQAAAELGITLEHLRYLARKHPAEARDLADSTAPPRVRFAALLSAEQLRELVEPGQLAAPDRGPLRHQPQDPPRRTHRPPHPDATQSPTRSDDRSRPVAAPVPRSTGIGGTPDGLSIYRQPQHLVEPGECPSIPRFSVHLRSIPTTEDSARDAQAFWDGEYRPEPVLGPVLDPSAATSDTFSEGGR